MDVVLKARGVRVTDQFRRAAQQKLGKLSRLDPRVVRVEVEIISERNRRLDGAKRLEGALHLPRRTLRARADGPDADVALDRLVDRLERMVRDHHGKMRNRTISRANRLKSPGMRPEGAGPT